MRTTLHKCLRHCLQPTLVGRLLLAQMLVLSLLWGVLTVSTYFEPSAPQIQESPVALQQNEIYAAVLATAENFANEAGRQGEALHTVEQAIQDTGGLAEIPEPSAPGVKLLVWQGDALLFKSDGIPSSLKNTTLDKLESFDIDGQQWQVRTRKSRHSEIHVTLAMPTSVSMDSSAIMADARNFYLQVLLVCVPVLLLPAWLSVRMALRPWKQLCEEISSRDPRDLSVLPFQPRHKELLPLVTAISGLLQRAGESTRREHRFVADAAHELRTPLAATRANVEALLDQDTSPAQTELLGSLLRSNDRAVRVASQLLALMRSDAIHANIPLRRIDLDALVQLRLATLADLATPRELDLEFNSTPDIFVLGDDEGLISLIDNLVENAIKYSPQAGVVTVCLSRTASHALLNVSDQGPGIQPELYARVFDRFFRAPEQTMSGSGLGLAIVKSVAERHGGSIHLKPAQNACGLQVTLRLPLAQEHANNHSKVSDWPMRYVDGRTLACD